MSPQALLDKAIRAVASAELLFEAGDFDGACNRAYYGMFDAARAALCVLDPSFSSEMTRTHTGLISIFSLKLVKTGLVSIELGKTLNKAEDLRLIADYKGDPLEEEQAQWVVEQAKVFVDAMLKIAS